MVKKATKICWSFLMQLSWGVTEVIVSFVLFPSKGLYIPVASNKYCKLKYKD